VPALLSRACEALLKAKSASVPDKGTARGVGDRDASSA
jgi:hypothetical protein